ncbi:MAG: PAS domain S-box protein [Gammaproteobacteria bacterium]|nr:PAS domain S-box protein [Gammaproteobacteria bacterium]
MSVSKKPDSITNFESIVACLPGHVYWMDRNGILLGCNERQANSHGFASSDEVIGKSLRELMDSFHAELVLAANEKVMRSGITQTIEELFPYKNGEVGVFLSKKVPLRNGEGEITGILGISFDITAQKKSEKKKIALLENVVAMMPGHVYWKDQEGRFLGCNDAQAISAGMKNRDEMIGKNDWDMPWAGPQAEEIRINDLHVMATGETITKEEDIILPSGTMGTFLSKKAPLRDDEGKTIGIVGVSLDITAQKRAVALEYENAIAHERASTMKLLAASIAHELRTPLAAINSAMSWVGPELTKLLNAYEKACQAGVNVEEIPSKRLKLLGELCSDVIQETQSADNIINMLLVKLNQVEVSPEDLTECSIVSIVKNALARYPFVSEAQKQLIHFDDRVDFKLMGTELLVTHILFNLLKNALYFIEASCRGEIFISIERGSVENKLHFKDTSKGISKEVLPFIFRRFFSRTRHGAGIGLAFCKQAMHGFGGNIECESEEGVYTEFILSFPVIKGIES